MKILDTRRINVQEDWAIPGDSSDIRAQKTRRCLGRALVDLLRDREYDEIQVADIAEQAGIGRSTFYRHFKDKDDLLIRQTVAFRRMMGRNLTLDPSSNGWHFPIALLFGHVREVSFYYDALMRSRKLERVLAIGQIVLAEEFEKQMASVASRWSGVPISILAQHLASTLTNLLHWWVSHHYPYAPEEMERYFHQLISSPADSRKKK